MHNTTTALRQKVTLQLQQIVRLPRITFLYSTILLFKLLYELSPNFNGCKMEYDFILWVKGPLRFSMFRTCLSSKLAWLVTCFSQRLTWLWLSRSFLEALCFCLRSCKALFNSIGFCPSVVARSHFEVGGLACFYEWMDGVSDFRTYAWLHFLPGQSTRCKFQKGCKQSCKNGSVLMRQPPAKVEKSWNCLRSLFRFAFGLGKLNKTKNPSISFM